jgi:hypothetical protein
MIDMTQATNTLPAQTVMVCDAAFEFDVQHFGDAVARWKASLVGAATTVENADNLFGRTALVALLSGTVTPANLALAAYAAFNPKSAKGDKCKPKLQGDIVLSCSSLRNAKGGDNARKALDALFAIHATMNGQTDATGANIMAPAVLAFIGAEKGSASSVRKLAEVLAKAALEHAKALGLVNDNEPEQGEGEGEGSGEGETSKGEPAPLILSNDLILSIAAAIESADNSELAALGDAVTILCDVIESRFAFAVEGEASKAKAA